MSEVQIVPFRPDHAAAWAALNEAWLAEGGFAVEAKDRKVIDDPQGAILSPGGRIFMAADVVAVAAGRWHSLALKSDGCQRRLKI